MSDLAYKLLTKGQRVAVYEVLNSSSLHWACVVEIFNSLTARLIHSFFEQLHHYLHYLI